MISKGTIAASVAFVGFGWLFFTATERTGQRYERLREVFPDPFCEDAARVVDGGFMHEEQYFASGCTMEVLVDQRGTTSAMQAFDLLRQLLESYPAMTETVCWEPALKYLTKELPLHEYIGLDCDLTRIPSDDVFESWLSQR